MLFSAGASYLWTGTRFSVDILRQRPAQDCGALELGVDAYYKIATDLIDNGNFGQALVLSALNYARAYNEGVELKAKFVSGNFEAYGNLAVAQQRATDVVSNQYLFDSAASLDNLGGLTEFQYIQTHYIYTDHTQIVTVRLLGVDVGVAAAWLLRQVPAVSLTPWLQHRRCHCSANAHACACNYRAIAWRGHHRASANG